MLLSLILSLLAQTNAIFDGKSLSGWELKAVHGGHGGKWWVDGSEIVGLQGENYDGGLLGTKKLYGDFEVMLEFKADEPLDSGLFLRTQPNGDAYQVTIDAHPDGLVGSVYGTGVGGFTTQYPEWRKWYHKGDWNKLRVRIVGQPPHITVWLNGEKTVDWQDPEGRLPATGYVGIQIHGGKGAFGEGCKIRYRKLMLREVPAKKGP